ncbi:hypothetical protein UPYG_G00013560 [Umbra pygmaea]|uniref:Opioid growth factor receptor (OGFr) conserved domain-containing protein n=1 Tax=Umbra pygmaea TaxID=75934 RepID=A0ABD0XJ40_UMBPY
MMEDDLVCDYDSTWDTESDGDDPGGESQTRCNQDKNKSNWYPFVFSNTSSRNMRAAKDMQNYRRGYPNLTDDEGSDEKMINLNFYLNKYPSSPDDISIDLFHKEWKTDYKRLERVHSYIQWLFPLREPGVNYMASELTKKEIQAFRESEEAKKRLVESYELMLGFYGIQLVNKETGEVKRADNWRERFTNLERNMHNNLRITRILKSLGELGFEHYQSPLVRFFLEETLVKRTLSSVKRSVLDYFLFAVRDKKKRRELLRYAFQQFEPKDKFVWCPRKIHKQLKKLEKVNGEASDESRLLRGKAREGEPGGTQKEDMSGPEMPLENANLTEGSTVDPPGPMESSVDSEPPKNGNGIVNVEMDDSSNPVDVFVTGDQSMDEGLKQHSLTNDSVLNVVEPETALSEAESEESKQPTKKKKEVDMPGNDTTEKDFPILSDNNNQPGKMHPSATTSSKAKADDSKKNLHKKGFPPDTIERDKKLPRTDYGDKAIDGGNTEDAGKDQANGKSMIREFEDAMDVESQPKSDQDTVTS